MTWWSWQQTSTGPPSLSKSYMNSWLSWHVLTILNSHGGRDTPVPANRIALGVDLAELQPAVEARHIPRRTTETCATLCHARMNSWLCTYLISVYRHEAQRYWNQYYWPWNYLAAHKSIFNMKYLYKYLSHVNLGSLFKKMADLSRKGLINAKKTTRNSKKL